VIGDKGGELAARNKQGKFVLLHLSLSRKRWPVRRSCRSFERRSEVGERRHRRERRERKTPSAIRFPISTDQRDAI
jgi:hypothetical protein